MQRWKIKQKLTDEQDNTVLHTAAYKGHLEVVKFLHTNGANVNVKKETLQKVYIRLKKGIFLNGETC